MYNPLIIIPIYNHTEQFKKLLPLLKKEKIDILISDDGSSSEQSKELEKLASKEGCFYIKTPTNEGKGSAVIKAFFWGLDHKYSHAIQIDADGQHDSKDISNFIEISKNNPDSLICGIPIYDESVPRSRYIGRKITNFWCFVETLSLDVKDAMCGFRIYPLNKKTSKIFSSLHFMRMGFDIEILVKFIWEGVGLINIPTKVIYPKDGKSHFKLVKDNIKISMLHTYLCLLSPFMIVKRFLVFRTNPRP